MFIDYEKKSGLFVTLHYRLLVRITDIFLLSQRYQDFNISRGTPYNQYGYYWVLVITKTLPVLKLYCQKY